MKLETTYVTVLANTIGSDVSIINKKEKNRHGKPE
jgi:hypothetical protein